MEFTNEQFTDMVVRLREFLQESRVAFAERFGVSSQAVGNWERGISGAKWSTQKKVMRLYKKTLGELPAGATTALEADKADEQMAPTRKPRVPQPDTYVHIGATEVHEALAEFHEMVNKDHVNKALEFTAKKYDIPRAHLRRAMSLFLYLVEDSRPPVTLKTLIATLSGHKESE